MSINRGWIKKVWYTYTVEYYSAIKKNKVKPFAVTWKDLEVSILREVKSDKERYILHCSHVESKKMVQINLFTKQK